MARVAYNELSNYNSGKLIYKWFDLDDKTKDEHYAELHEWLAKVPPPYPGSPPCEEWCVGDIEGIPEGLYGDYGISDDWFKLVEAAESSHLDVEVFLAGAALDIPAESIEDAYYGSHESVTDFAHEYAENIGIDSDPANWPYTYIDWERAGNELLINDFMSENGHYFTRNW